MKKCSHRQIVLPFAAVFRCSHPSVRTPSSIAWPQICDRCRFADDGIRTTEPRRLDDLPRGLGDTASDFLKAVGLGPKQGCGCSTRQSWLNQHVSYERLPTLAREGRTWAKWLCRLLRIPTGDEPQRILFRFPHGFGDAVQFTVVLRHLRAKYPQHRFDVVTKPGTASMFSGLAHRAIEKPTADAIWAYQPVEHYDHAVNIDWWEPDGCYVDSPATKAEKCLREAFGIEPDLSLCRYQIKHDQPDDMLDRFHIWFYDRHGHGGYVLIHYQGTTAQQNKNIDEGIFRKVVARVQASGCVPIILDWDNRSCFARGRCDGAIVIDRTSPLWRGTEHGDGATIAALASRARLCIGIDSGPGHVFGATETPTLIVWHKHHPLNYYCLAPNVVHVLPRDHQRFIHGDSDSGARFFRKHYRHYTCERNMRYELPELVERTLRGERIDAKAKHSTELFHGVRIRRRYRMNDAGIVDEVIKHDGYGIRKKDCPRDVRYVLDIGGHIGSFAVHMHKQRKQAEIACVEVNRRNLPYLRANVASFARVLHAACTYEPDVVLLDSVFRGASAGPGDSEVVPRDNAVSRLSNDARRHRLSEPPRVVTIESLLEELGWPYVDVLKLDCEGAEWSILEGLACLDRIGLIVGEYHRGEARLRELAERRFADWGLEILSNKLPQWDDGAFRLTSPAVLAATQSPRRATRTRTRQTESSV